MLLIMPQTEKKAYHKPLSFDTTMRNPERIAQWIDCLLEYEGKILTNEIIINILKETYKRKLTWTMYMKHNSRLWDIYTDDTKEFNEKDLQDIIENSADGKNKKHKEAGFDKGWPSRFATRFSLAMEFGFVKYAIGEPIIISKTGHMLINAYNEEQRNAEKIQNIFLNTLMKYQSNNPYRKTLNANVPLLLLLNVIKLLKERDEESAGVYRKEISLLICWPNNNAKELYDKILEIRDTQGFKYSDEYIYDICLNYLVREGKCKEEIKKEFKMSKITVEAVDDLIRKMRITGIISLRGGGRFLDFNTLEMKKINYILENYTKYTEFDEKEKYFEYMGEIDNNILEFSNTKIENEVEIIQNALEKYSEMYTKKDIYEELKIVCEKRESKDILFKSIDGPERLEFLTSIALKQHFSEIRIYPNYKPDDEGIPTCTAGGGKADIECYDNDCNSFFEVTLMADKKQATQEIPAITQHLLEAMEKDPKKMSFSVMIAPNIQFQSRYMVDFSRQKYNVDIKAFSIYEFIEKIAQCMKIIDFCVK